MEIVIGLAFILTTLVPIHMAFWLGIRKENDTRRRLLKSIWKIRLGGKNAR